MNMTSWLHILALTVQALTLSLLILWVFRWRNSFGIGFFIATVASLTSNELRGLQLSSTEHVSLIINFGGALLFSAKLFAVLLVYVREDAAEARALLYGIFAGSILSLVYASSTILHVWISGVDSSAYMAMLRRCGVHTFGMAILIIDTIALILAYEWLARRLRSVWLISVLALAIALSVDNTIYYLLHFGEATFSSVLLQTYLGKWYAALIYGSVFALALRWNGIDRDVKIRSKLGDVFDSMTFRQRFEALKRRAEFDSLTGLKSRARFDEEIEAKLQGSGMRLIIVDIDHFKRVNDRYGHLRGDTVLRDVAARIRQQLPDNAHAYRYGGEEFIVIGPLRDQQIDALRSAVANLPVDDLEITVSIGAVDATEANDVRTLFEIADQRLYRAKSDGRNRTVLA